MPHGLLWIVGFNFLLLCSWSFLVGVCLVTFGVGWRISFGSQVLNLLYDSDLCARIFCLGLPRGGLVFLGCCYTGFGDLRRFVDL